MIRKENPSSSEISYLIYLSTIKTPIRLGESIDTAIERRHGELESDIISTKLGAWYWACRTSGETICNLLGIHSNEDALRILNGIDEKGTVLLMYNEGKPSEFLIPSGDLEIHRINAGLYLKN